MNTKAQKLTLITLAALSFLFISTQGCQKAAERPAKVNAKISNDLIDITKTADVNSQGRFQPDAQMNNSVLLDKAISKVSDEALKADLIQSKERGQLTFKIEENKVVLIKIMHKSEVKEEDIRGKAYYTVLTLKTEQLSQKFTVLTTAVSSAESVSATAQIDTKNPEADLLFIVMVTVGFKSGVLEHEKTDYNEKKSILNLEEKPLNESTHIILTEVVESK